MSNLFQKIKNLIDSEVTPETGNVSTAENVTVTIPSLYKRIKNMIDGKELPEENIKSETKTEIINNEIIPVKLTPFEEKINNLYIGCFNVNPENTESQLKLGDISNQNDCIKLGQETKSEYIALQNGSDCLGLTKGDLKNMDNVSRNQCSTVCNEANAGYCGGVLKNQVYATTLLGKAVDIQTHESFKNLENFSSFNKEMKMINKNITKNDIECEKPINKYMLSVLLIIILLLCYLLIELFSKE
jgi:hypothetical protein